MRVSIVFEDVVKKYGDNTVIPGLSLSIQQGEFFTLLGPSGCGKTTLLRMVAGFNSIEAGTIRINGKVINRVDPSKRNIGMVFQNYAVFPHMAVKDNVAFGLKNRKVEKQELERRVDEILRVVQIDSLKDRMPDNMSGGQQQRVALARAIVINPQVLLMDEPLSNLDAKLRVEMRNAIKEIHNNYGITTIYVTHDQEEAMAISDRIAVMNNGRIEQCSTPQNLYMRPVNTFVASFIGRVNLVRGKLILQDDKVFCKLGDSYSILMDNLRARALERLAEKGGLTVKAAIRPEDFQLVKDGPGLKAKIRKSVFLGYTTQYLMELEDATTLEVLQESEVSRILPAGGNVILQVKKEKINLYSEDGEENYTTGVINDVENFKA